jgi:hypothetical protein
MVFSLATVRSGLRFGNIRSPRPEAYAAKVYPTREQIGTKTSLWIPRANPKKPFLSWPYCL